MRLPSTCLVVLSLAFPALAAADGWPGWGGPRGDFQVEARPLADAWPVEGPPVLWSRPLGAGYSGVAARDGVLYTQYRDGDDELAVALDARDGGTVWEHRYPAPGRDGNATQFGTGPHATPLVLEDRVVTLGYTGQLQALSRKDGKLLWSHHLVDDLGGSVLQFGYSASPILHDGSVIVLVGGAQGAVAFQPADGSIVWKSPPSTISYATPIVIELGGQDQIVHFSEDAILGLDAADGTELWSHPCVNQYRNNATGPLWAEDGLLWVATQLDGGTRALRLTRRGDGTVVEQVWRNDKIAYHFWNGLRLGDHAYAAIGSNGSFLAGVDLRNGEIVWRERGFPKANLVHAGDRTLLLDEEGGLALARLSPQGIEILSRATVVESRTWTAPTLLGTTLVLRDRETIRALDLGVPAAAPSR